MSGKWIWQQGGDWQQGGRWQQGAGWRQETELRGIAMCALPQMSDDDTKTVFRNENCINAEKETVGCSIRIDCEQGCCLSMAVCVAHVELDLQNWIESYFILSPIHFAWH